MILPGTVAVAVPIWIARRNHTALTVPATFADGVLVLAGVAALLAGLWLFGWSLAWFVTEGRGTLAPWDPPRRLVVRGPYRYVRNPMISGIIFITFGEALMLRSPRHALWALFLVLMNVAWIPSYEEPTLERKFGDDYREYCRHVRRFIPRLRPYEMQKK